MAKGPTRTGRGYHEKPGTKLYHAYVLGRIAIAAMLREAAAERRAERVPVDEDTRRPLVMRYDKEKDETFVLSEYRREHPYVNARSKYAPGTDHGGLPGSKFKGYSQRKGATLRRYSGIVKPVGFLAQLKGRLLGADGKELA